MKTEYELEYDDDESYSAEFDLVDDTIEEEDQEFQLDGYFTVSSYHESYEPFAEIWQNYFLKDEQKPLIIKPMTSIKSVDESVRSLTDVFDKLKSMTVFKIPKNFTIRQSGTFPVKKTRSKLCRSLLQNIPCEFGLNCKFAHHFEVMQKCKFDHCKKTKLVGPGLFKTPELENICPLRHNFESLDSFILRTREKTRLKMTISIFKNNIEDLIKIFYSVQDCDVQLTIV
jgi:hypothetical protein